MLPRERATTTVVFFLGGCTYTEIAALRWVGRQNKGQRAHFAGIFCWSVLLNHCARPEVPDSDDGHYQRQHDHRQHRRHGERHVKGGRAIACCRACMPPRTSCEFYLGIDGYISGAIYGAPSRPSPHPTYSIERVRSGRIVGCSAPFARCTDVAAHISKTASAIPSRGEVLGSRRFRRFVSHREVCHVDRDKSANNSGILDCDWSTIDKLPEVKLGWAGEG